MKTLIVGGVDGVLIGPDDLSGSCGMPGKLDHPEVVQAVQTVLDACKRHRKSAGIHLVHPTPERISSLISQGFTFLALGVDLIFLQQGAAAALDSARQAAAR